MKERAGQVSTTAFLILSAIFFICSVFIMFSQAVYIPYWDQWDWLRRYYSGNETLFSLLFTPINGHIVAIPGLLYRADIVFFKASNIANLTVMFMCIVAICVILRAQFSGLSEHFCGRTANVFFAAAVILMTWLHNWENLFWPFQVHLYLSLLFTFVALIALSSVAVKTEKRAIGTGVAVAMVMGLMASASFGAGMAIWGSVLIIVWLGCWTNTWKWCTAAFAICIAVSLIIYLMPWTAQQAAPFDALASLNFVAMYLGSPLFHGGNVRVLATDVNSLILVIGVGYFGIALACTNAYRVVRARRHRSLNSAEMFFVGLMVFSLSTAVMGALTRTGGGLPSPALSSRYGALCLLFWISALPLFVASHSLSKERIRNYETVAPVLFLLLMAVSQSAYLEWWTKWRNLVELAKASLVSAVADDEYLGYIFPPGRSRTVELVTKTLMREETSPLFEERFRVIGRPVAEFGIPAGVCPATIVETKELAGGVRIKGLVADSGTPFDSRMVIVTDNSRHIIGVGAVEKRWPGFTGNPDADRKRFWAAYAPIGESALNSIRLYLSLERGLCSMEGTVARGFGLD